MATPSVNSPQPLAERAVPLLICLVDDAADYHVVVNATLKRCLPHGQLSSFLDGQAFLDELILMSKKPHLIILDQHMPGWSGHQTLLALKQQPACRFIPVVMMSMDASYSEVASFYQAGAATFLRKPTDFNAFQEILLMACQYASKPKTILE